MTEIVITGRAPRLRSAATWHPPGPAAAGKSGVRAITEEWANELPVKIAAYVKVDPSEIIDRVKARRSTGPPSWRSSPPAKPGKTPGSPGRCRGRG